MKSALILILCAAAALVAACTIPERSRNLADPKVPGRVLAVQVCAACHGADGNSVSPNFPRLAGQQKTYFISEMKEFRSHDRADPAGFEYMWGLSRSLTDAQIEELADYFGAQTPRPADHGTAAPNERGKRIFETGDPQAGQPACAACHGPAGAGNETFPRIGAQHADYLLKQLRIFQRTDQRPDGAVMKQVTHALSEEDMRAVADYVRNLPVE